MYNIVPKNITRTSDEVRSSSSLVYSWFEELHKVTLHTQQGKTNHYGNKKIYYEKKSKTSIRFDLSFKLITT